MVYCIQFQLWKYIPGESLIWQGAAIIVYLVAGCAVGGECDNFKLDNSNNNNNI